MYYIRYTKKPIPSISDLKNELIQSKKCITKTFFFFFSLGLSFRRNYHVEWFFPRKEKKKTKNFLFLNATTRFIFSLTSEIAAVTDQKKKSSIFHITKWYNFSDLYIFQSWQELGWSCWWWGLLCKDCLSSNSKLWFSQRMSVGGH